MSYFMKQTYGLVVQETKDNGNAYVLKNGNQYIWCWTKSFSKKEVCYVMILKKMITKIKIYITCFINKAQNKIVNIKNIGKHWRIV